MNVTKEVFFMLVDIYDLKPKQTILNKDLARELNTTTNSIFYQKVRKLLREKGVFDEEYTGQGNNKEININYKILSVIIKETDIIEKRNKFIKKYKPFTEGILD